MIRQRWIYFTSRGARRLFPWSGLACRAAWAMISSSCRCLASLVLPGSLHLVSVAVTRLRCERSPGASLPLPWRAEGSKAKTKRSLRPLLLLLHPSRWRNGGARPPQSSIEPPSSPLTSPLSPLKGFNFKASNPSFYSIISWWYHPLFLFL